MAVLSTLLHMTAFKTPILRTLIPSVALAFGIQAAVAVPSIAARTERFYDLSGSITYLACTGLSLYLPLLRARAAGQIVDMSIMGLASRNWRQLALSAAVSIWAIRLGSFLFKRITAENGQDSRFEEIRGSTPKFFGAFMAQATWVSLCTLPVIALNSLPATAFSALPAAIALTDVIGLALYIFGITFEATADRQKSNWMEAKKEKKHDQDFITEGLWGKSRHPNYFGESTLWTGIATLAGGVLASKAGLSSLGLGLGLGGQLTALAMCAVSPAFVTFLLLKVSGVPMSENKYDKRYGDRKDYQEWKKNVPMFIPKF
ncbi:DUF1295-domain-containing protein [Saccharata proteae CBS 121410]|uniref:DUF1295-domain-containing protein n=1 Tax=Saccharata proteae CBS 121410 TaxID=1314787 RepID=A0A6A5YCF5_9PEZI|nr:DUF1295-domain-containing protein [Saccharata proteae CBS 121410]